MNMKVSENDIVNQTAEIFPGMIVGGMELSEACSIPRMGPSFGGMMASGIKASHLAQALFNRLEVGEHGEVVRELA